MSATVERPQPPGENECCEGGCSPCVWDRYYDEIREWQAQQAAQKTKETAEKAKDDAAK